MPNQPQLGHIQYTSNAHAANSSFKTGVVSELITYKSLKSDFNECIL